MISPKLSRRRLPAAGGEVTIRKWCGQKASPDARPADGVTAKNLCAQKRQSIGRVSFAAGGRKSVIERRRRVVRGEVIESRGYHKHNFVPESIRELVFEGNRVDR